MYRLGSGLGLSFLRSVSSSWVATATRPCQTFTSQIPQHIPLRRPVLLASTSASSISTCDFRVSCRACCRPYSTAPTRDHTDFRRSPFANHDPHDRPRFDEDSHFKPPSPVKRAKKPPPKTADAVESAPLTFLVNFLSSDIKEKYQEAKKRLPPGISKVDAYLAVRKMGPMHLSEISDEHMAALFHHAAREGLGGAFRHMITDLLGEDYASNQKSQGLFRACYGTKRRLVGLNAMLLAATTGEMLQMGNETIKIFSLFLKEWQIARSKGNVDEASKDEPLISLPDNFPTGEARRLVSAIVVTQSPDLAPTMAVLQAHLEKTAHDFPVAREGSKLISYYLLPDLQDHQAASHVVKMMRDTNAIPEDVVRQAQFDGKAYLDHEAKRLDIKQGDDDYETLLQTALKISLRIIALKAIMIQRPEGRLQYRKAFEALMSTLDSAKGDKTDEHFGSPASIGARHFRTAFRNLLAQPIDTAVEHASLILQRCNKGSLAIIENEDLKYFCDMAFAKGKDLIAAQGFLTVVKAKSACIRKGTGKEAALDWNMVEPDSLFKILFQLNKSGQSVMTHGTLRSFGILPLTMSSIEHIDHRLTGSQKAKLIQVLADAHLKEPALALYKRWASVKFKDPKHGISPPPSEHVVSEEAFGGNLDANPIMSSSGCMLALVRLLCRKGSFQLLMTSTQDLSKTKGEELRSAREDIDMARFIVENFKSCRNEDQWNHYDLTSLASACFSLRDSVGAFDAIGALVFKREIPDDLDISVLFGGLVTMDPEKAVRLYMRFTGAENPDTTGAQGGFGAGRKVKSRPSTALNDPSDRLVATLISRCLAAERIDLVNELLQHIRATGKVNKIGRRAFRLVLSPEFMSPRHLVNKLISVVRTGWKPDGLLLDHIARKSLFTSQTVRFDAVRVDTERTAPKPQNLEKNPMYASRLRIILRLSLLAAIDLVRIGYEKLGLVNLNTMNIILNKLEGEARIIYPLMKPTLDHITRQKGGIWQREKRNYAAERWITHLDTIVFMLRWTPYFDRGTDLRHGVPLHKSSGGSDGKLVPIGLEEMTDSANMAMTGFRRVETVDDEPKTAGEGEGEEEKEKEKLILPHLRRPNVLPLGLFRHLIKAYLSLRDYAGAAQVAAWMRDDAHADLGKTADEEMDFVRVVNELLELEVVGDRADPLKHREIRESLAGQVKVPRTKMWWRPFGLTQISRTNKM